MLRNVAKLLMLISRNTHASNGVTLCATTGQRHHEFGAKIKEDVLPPIDFVHAISLF